MQNDSVQNESSRKAVANTTRTDRLHPTVARLIVGLGLLFVIGAWTFAGGSGYIGAVLGVLTVFTIVVFAIPFDLLRVWRNHAPNARPVRRSFHDWLESDFEIWNDRLKGRDAMINALLPLAAVGVGAIFFAIAFQLVTANLH